MLSAHFLMFIPSAVMPSVIMAKVVAPLKPVKTKTKYKQWRAKMVELETAAWKVNKMIRDRQNLYLYHLDWHRRNSLKNSMFTDLLRVGGNQLI